jgi:hypothetical protein
MMELELDLVLNKINCKLFVEMTKTKGFKNPKKLSSKPNQSFHQVFKKRVRTKTKVSFENQELDNKWRQLLFFLTFVMHGSLPSPWCYMFALLDQN